MMGFLWLVPFAWFGWMALVAWVNSSYDPGRKLARFPLWRAIAGFVLALVSVGAWTWLILWMIWPREYFVRGERLPLWWEYGWYALFFGAALAPIVFHGPMAFRAARYIFAARRAAPDLSASSRSAAGPRAGSPGPFSSATNYLACSLVFAGSIALAAGHLEILDRTPSHPQTDVPLTMAEAGDFDGYPVFWLGESHDGLPNYALRHHDNDRTDGISRDNVVAAYRNDDRSRSVIIRTSPICAGPAPPDGATTIGEGARLQRTGPRHTAIWSGDAYILVHHDPKQPESPEAVLAAIQPLNEAARELAGWPAPSAC